MEEKYTQIRGAGLGLAAVSYDSPAVLKNFSDRKHIQFPLISDEHSEIIRRFGILNDSVKKGTPVYGIPYPGIYVLDARGVVTAKFFEDDFKERDTAGLILLKQFGIQPVSAHELVKAKHFPLGAAAMDPNVHMGQRVSVVLEGTLPPDMHVYAPGVKGYIAIDWQMPDTSAYKVGPVEYPASTMMRLEAIQETVPVYTGFFRLVRNVVVGSDQDVTPLLDSAGNLKAKGTFRYQACDTEKCFLPETVPMTVTLHFEGLDLTRVPAELQRK